jgi:hypothetical protein
LDPALLASWLVEGLVHNWALMSIVCTLSVLLIVPAVVLRRYVRLIINIRCCSAPSTGRRCGA